MRIKTVFIIVMGLICSGCASIVSKSKYPVEFRSEPEGATVVVQDRDNNEVHRGVTPCTATLNAGAGYFTSAKYTARFEHKGYLPATEEVAANLDPWYFGNLLLGGVIGMIIVDPITGAMWEFDKSVTGTLKPGGTTAIPVASPAASPATLDQGITPPPRRLLRWKVMPKMARLPRLPLPRPPRTSHQQQTQYLRP